mgnify:CR=1 FL=1
MDPLGFEPRSDAPKASSIAKLTHGSSNAGASLKCHEHSHVRFQRFESTLISSPSADASSANASASMGEFNALRAFFRDSRVMNPSSSVALERMVLPSTESDSEIIFGCFCIQVESWSRISDGTLANETASLASFASMCLDRIADSE